MTFPRRPKFWPRRPLLRLAVLVAVGLVLGAGRQDWTKGLAFRSWVFSAYFFLLLLVGALAVLRALRLDGSRWSWAALSIVTLALNLPYRWLGLERLYYFAHHPDYYSVPPTFIPEWLADAASHHRPWGSPDFLLLGLLLIGLAAGGFALLRKRSWLLFAGLFVLIVVETWLHVSGRSPYSYLPHYSGPDALHYTYTMAMLPNNGGLVNLDAPTFTRLEELFDHPTADMPTYLIRRPLAFYVAQHLSYFMGNYLAFLLINPLLWLAAVVSIYQLSLSLSGSRLLARYAAFLVAVSSGFITYVAQPMPYLMGFAVLAIAINLYDRILRADGLRSLAGFCATSVVFGLTFLTYDTFAWAPIFLLYPLLHRVSPLRGAVPVLGGMALYALYGHLVYGVFQIHRETMNEAYIGESFRAIAKLHHAKDLPQLYDLLIQTIGDYFSEISQAIFFIPVLLGLCGLFLAPTRFLFRAAALLLLLPSFATCAFFCFGQTYLYRISRFQFPAYIGMALLGASFLAAIVERLRAADRPVLAWISAAVPLAACFAMTNIDVFGRTSYLYYHFYWLDGGRFQ
jgi:hypothetical protein